jgi:hypothetical protein
MPCRDDGGFGYDNHNACQDKIDKLTRMLCEVLGTLSSTSHYSTEVQEWWAKHREFDKKRLEQEVQTKLNSLKLTHKEKQTLLELLAKG